MEHSRRKSPPHGACALETKLINIWYAPDVRHAHETLEKLATHFRALLLSNANSGYEARASSGELNARDKALERIIFAFVSTFMCKLDDPLIVGFRNLVPLVFELYLKKGSGPRAQVYKPIHACRPMCATWHALLIPPPLVARDTPLGATWHALLIRPPLFPRVSSPRCSRPPASTLASSAASTRRTP